MRDLKGGSVFRRALSHILATVALFGVIAAVTAPPSHAAYGNVYVSFPSWLGNCPAGGSVIGVAPAANGNIWSGGDFGDDLIYPRVVMFAGAPYNQISAQPHCGRPWYQGGNYRGPAVSAAIRPTRHGQTFWIGPGGQRSN